MNHRSSPVQADVVLRLCLAPSCPPFSSRHTTRRTSQRLLESLPRSGRGTLRPHGGEPCRRSPERWPTCSRSRSRLPRPTDKPWHADDRARGDDRWSEHRAFATLSATYIPCLYRRRSGRPFVLRHPRSKTQPPLLRRRPRRTEHLFPPALAARLLRARPRSRTQPRPFLQIAMQDCSAFSRP